MEGVTGIFQNDVLKVAVLAWFIAQVIKVVLTLVKFRKLDFSRFIGSGGMPSSHSSFVMALSTGVGQKVGYDSVLYAVTLGIALVVMYDASGVRLAAGKQAAILNQIIDKLSHHDLNIDKPLKELLGHTNIEVIVGAGLGIILASVLV